MKDDQYFMRLAIDAARVAREKGNHPFGAILVDEEGQVLMSAGNTVLSDKDCTAHAELNLMKRASREFESDFLAGCTLYASTEPCPMCSGAIFWGNVRRVVFGLSQKGLYEMTGERTGETLYLPCRDLFATGNKPIEVVGPILEEEARAVHSGFW